MKTMKYVAGGALALWLAAPSGARAQIPFTKLNTNPAAANAAFAPQNPLGPTGNNYQVNYPYPGQCLATAANLALFPTTPVCGAATSFACPAGEPAGATNRSAGGWAACGSLVPFKVLNPIVPASVPVAGTPATPKFVWEVLNPPDYTPDTTTYTGADYYEIGLHEAWGFQTLAGLGAFPNPLLATPAGPPVPNGMQWTGLTCNIVGGCSCPADASATFAASYCRAAGKVPQGAPLYTPIWGVGQINMGGTLGVNAGGPATSWSSNAYVATWPSISIRGTKGRPVVVKWTNEFPNNHVLCPHPDVADWPCAIDRTFMGVKTKIDPAALQGMSVPAESVNKFGSPQQPDNSWVTHLHGGEVPPSTDGFAEKWFGNTTTAALYSPTQKFVNPPFENPSGVALLRPGGHADTYAYPMVQEEATIWFHDHTLGKTHQNVIAGPAGFFPVKEPTKHGKVTAGTCAAAAGQTCDYSWLDPVTEIRGGLNIPAYDMFFAVQDRSFNDDGSINFSNGLGQTIPPPPAIVPVGYTPVTSGVNPQVHPVWVPEYFGDHALVNGVLWPKKTTEPGWYRIRLVDGSDSRCWTIGFQQAAAAPAPGAKVTFNVPFYVLANDQGYLKSPFLAAGKNITMCPGERYELLVNFGDLPGLPPGAAATVYLVNNAPAPFPAGITPQAAASPYAEMNVLMAFNVTPTSGPGIKSCGVVGAPLALTWDPANMAANLLKSAAGAYVNLCMPLNPALQVDPGYVELRPAAWPLPAGTAAVVRQLYLNERVDGVTLAPMGMQLNGVPFEYKVTETPKAGTREYWQFINLTVDSHPMHPHIIRHQLVARQKFNVGGYKKLLCGSTTCQPGTAPGGEMQVVPDPALLLTGAPTLITAASEEGGFKDAVQAPPGQVTTIVADWTSRWTGAGTPGFPAGTANAPGTPGAPVCVPNGTTVCGNAASFVYETITSGPYVWHCHINSHEDSEMMRTSLVVP